MYEGSIIYSSEHFLVLTKSCMLKKCNVQLLRLQKSLQDVTGE